ncbi:zinc finger protein ZAT8-like [Panicum virgatum]|uniref:C2H2-type domain-containing protein n=1 Tax=Panicum virgatum TaxID=38727 RepID=A0A8T0N5Z0_PANVG|nr:zinc finger protein ZAT8-like [Panicum virgatum]KAG2544880.1 hypothetical protein PVAP13_9KG389801 [Panicum virgatum]
MKRLAFGQEEPAELGIISVAEGVMLLLARGGGGGGGEPSASPRVFECKTCSRRFMSFQALGGHRASHKRPRASEAAPAKARAHGCAVCGVEFPLGQALGGHMRRHRAVAEETDSATAAASRGLAEAETKPDQTRGLLGLDLDLNIAPS